MAEPDDVEVTAEQVNQYINDTVRQQFEQLSADFRRQYGPPQVVQPLDPREAQQREVANIVNPVVEPRLQQIDFASRASQDYTQFYLRNPEAFGQHDEVEKLFQEAAQNGRPMARRAIYDYIHGRDYNADPAKFRERDKERQQRELDRARSAVDPGMGMAGNIRPENTPIGSLEDFAKLSSEEQAKRLDQTGFTF
jgi:hypothetical protein